MESLSFLEQENVITQFQDLLVISEPSSLSVDNTSTEVDIPKLNAKTLSLTDVTAELERRGITPKGFYSDDSRQLQRCFDDEHESYVEGTRKKLREEKTAEAQRELEQRKAELIRNEILEEKNALARKPRLAEWFRLIASKSCPDECRIDINNITARSLSKVLWNDTNIKSLDLSNMGLNDKAGSYIARALANNATLMKLELDGNQFGQQTCKELAKSLTLNNSLIFLSVSSNPLTKGGDDKLGCIELLAKAIQTPGLTSLSLWRCGIGIEGGKAICEAVAKTTTLISVEVGYNEFDDADVLLMNKQLEVNRKARDERLAQETEIARKKETIRQEELELKDIKEKERSTQKWLEEQEKKRAEARRLDLEQKEYEKQKEAEKLQQLAHAQKMEEERINATKKKGKKGKGKGKKKK